ncbi:MAG: hypothetical protein NEA02_15175 [Thermoanaerobaculia bacterium]|nr:hypothetical protein [Thermoanaerobaculia bacterium]
MRKKTAFMQWIDREIKADKGLARRVSQLVSEMKAESCGVSKSVLDLARHGQRVVLRRGRKPVAAVVSIADLRLLQKLDEQNFGDLRAVRAELKRKGTMPWEKVEADLGLK